MPNAHRVAVIIPALDESCSIQDIVYRLLSMQTPSINEVFVIDDCSADDTGTLATQAGATSLEPAIKLGAWAATQTGLRYADTLGYDFVITMDGDGQHNADEISTLLEPLINGSADAVIGSNPQRGSIPRKLAWSILRVLSSVEYRDITSGFRACNRHALKILCSREASYFDFQDIGVLMLLKKSGIRIAEVPVLMQPRTTGKSRIFSSWWRVAYFLAYSSLLALSKRSFKNQRRHDTEVEEHKQ